MPVILGVDSGSRWCAATALDGLVALAAGTFDVNPGEPKLKPAHIDERPAIDWLIGCALWSGASRIVVEHSESWAPWPGLSPAAMAATQANWVVCDRIVRALQRCSPVPVETIHVNAWRARVVPKDIRAGEGNTDAKVAASLARHLPVASLAIVNAVVHAAATARHQRDACGAALGWAMSEEKAKVAAAAPALPRAKRPPGAPRPNRNAAGQARLKAARLALRASVGCRCPARGRHEFRCPLAGKQGKKTKSITAA